MLPGEILLRFVTSTFYLTLRVVRLGKLGGAGTEDMATATNPAGSPPAHITDGTH